MSCNLSFDKISVGRYGAFGILKNGLVTGWGENRVGLLSNLIDLSGQITDIGTAEAFAIGILKNGKVTGWGNGTSAQITDIPNDINVKKVVCDYNYVLALKDNDEIELWGGITHWSYGDVNEWIASGIIISGGGTSTCTGSYNKKDENITSDYYFSKNQTTGPWIYAEGSTRYGTKIWKIKDPSLSYTYVNEMLNLSTINFRSPWPETKLPKINLKLNISNAAIATSNGEYTWTGDIKNNSFLFKNNNNNLIFKENNQWKLKDYQTGIITGQNLYTNLDDHNWPSLTGGPNASGDYSIIVSGGAMPTSTGEYIWTGGYSENGGKIYNNTQNKNYIYSDLGSYYIKDFVIQRNSPYQTYTFPENISFFQQINFESLDGDPSELPSGQWIIKITGAHEKTSTGEYIWTGEETVFGAKVLNNKYNNNFIYYRDSLFTIRDSLYFNTATNFNLYSHSLSIDSENTFSNWSGLHKIISYINPLEPPNGQKTLIISDAIPEHLNGEYAQDGDFTYNFIEYTKYKHGNNNNFILVKKREPYLLIDNSLFLNNNIDEAMAYSGTFNINTKELSNYLESKLDGSHCQLNIKINILNAGISEANGEYIWNRSSIEPIYTASNKSYIYLNNEYNSWFLNAKKLVTNCPRDTYTKEIWNLFSLDWQPLTEDYQWAKGNVGIKISNAGTVSSNGEYYWKGRFFKYHPYFNKTQSANYIKYESNLNKYVIYDNFLTKIVSELDTYRFYGNPDDFNYPSWGGELVEGSAPIPSIVKKIKISNSDQININKEYYLNDNIYYSKSNANVIFVNPDDGKWTVRNNENPIYFPGVITYLSNGEDSNSWQDTTWYNTIDLINEFGISTDLSVKVLQENLNISQPFNIPSIFTGEYIWTGNKIKNYNVYTNKDNHNLYFSYEKIKKHSPYEYAYTLRDSSDIKTTDELLSAYYSYNLKTWFTGEDYFGAEPPPTGIIKNLGNIKDITSTPEYGVLLTKDHRILQYGQGLAYYDFNIPYYLSISHQDRLNAPQNDIFNRLRINKPFTGINKVVSTAGCTIALLDNKSIVTWYNAIDPRTSNDVYDTLDELTNILYRYPNVQGRIIDVAIGSDTALLLLDDNTVTGIGDANLITGSSRFYDKYNNVISLHSSYTDNLFYLKLNDDRLIEISENSPTLTVKNPVPSCYKTNIIFYDIPNKSINDQPFNLEVSSDKAGIPITYKSSKKEIAEVDNNGLVTIKNEGLTKIIATQSGDNNYPYTVSEYRYLNVTNPNKMNSIINFPDLEDKTYIENYTFNLNATSNNNQTPLKYLIDNFKIGSIDDNGNVKINSAGETSISIFQNGNQNYNYASPIIKTLKVNYADPIGNCVDLTERFISGSYDLGNGYSRPASGQIIIPTLNPNLPIIQVVEGEEVVDFFNDTCDSDTPYYKQIDYDTLLCTRRTGIFEYKNTGTALVLFAQEGYDGKFDSSFCVFNLTILKAKIYNTGTQYFYPTGDFGYLSSNALNYIDFFYKNKNDQKINPVNQEVLNDILSLTSNDANITKQSSSLSIQPLKIGKILITGQIINPKFEDFSFVATLNSIKENTALSFIENNLVKYIEDSPFDVRYTTNNEQGLLTFSSSNPNVVTIDSLGKATATNAGYSVITLNQAGSEKYEAPHLDELPDMKIIILDRNKQTNPIAIDDISLKNINEDTSFKVMIKNNQNNQKPIIYSIDSIFSANVAEIDEFGWVTILNEGYAKISIFQEDFDNYNPAIFEKYFLVSNSSYVDNGLVIEPIPDQNTGNIYPIIIRDKNNNIVPLWSFSIFCNFSDAIEIIYRPEEDYQAIKFLKQGDFQLTFLTYLFQKPLEAKVKVNKGVQIINFDDLGERSYGDDPFYIGATSNNTTIPIIFSSSNTNVATTETYNDSVTKITIVGRGATIITANQAGNSHWESASLSKTLVISKMSRSINFPDILDKNYQDDNFNLNVTSSDNEATITYSSSNTSVATVSSSGVVTIVGAGSTTITASQIESANYNSVSVNKLLRINKITPIITFPQIENKIYQDPNFNLNVTSTNQASQITYSSSNTSVATVSSSGVVTVISAGSTTITASQASSNNYNEPLSVPRTLLVNKKTPTFNFPIIQEKNLNSAPFSLGVTSNNPTSSIFYSISNLLVATINQVGLVSIIREGKTSIQVSQAETANWTSAILTRDLEIIKPNPLEKINVRYPKIIKLSNLPNNIFYNPVKKYLQGYLQDEGTYNIKVYIEEEGTVCEKILSINAFKKYKKYIYPVNYPINVGFIKYNPHERIGLQSKIETYNHPTFGKILRHSDLGILYTKLTDSDHGNSTNTDSNFLLIISEDKLEATEEIMGYIDVKLKYSSSLDKSYLTINGYPIYFYKNDLDMYSINGKNNDWGLFNQNGQRIFV